MDPIQILLGSIKQTGSQINSGLSVILTLRGTILLKSPDLNRRLTENQCAVLNHNDFFTLESDSPNVILWVNMDRSWLQAVCPEAVNQRYFCCSTVTASASEPLYDDLRRSVTRAAMHYFRREEGYFLLLQAQLLKTLYTLMLHFNADEGKKGPEGEHRRLDPILNYLRLNYRESITLDSTAKAFYISAAHLSRTFRQELGVTFLEHLTALRLESAQRELLYSNDTITRIALNNGFSSTRAMSQQFQRAFGCTPAAYRRQAAGRTKRQPPCWISSSSDSTLETLARFMDTYEVKSGAEVASTAVTLPQTGVPLIHPELIVDIGAWSRVLWNTVQVQLRQAQEAVQFQYVRLSGVFRSGAKLNFSLEKYSFLSSFEELLAIGLTPMIQIEIETEGPLLRPVLELLLSRFGRSELSRWKFELCFGAECPLSMVRQAVYVLKGLLNEGQVGLYLVPEHAPMWEEESSRTLLPLMTDFVTTRIDPNEQKSPSDALTFERYHRRYFQNALNQVQNWLTEHGRQAPIYLIEWNTLTGHSIVEAGEFHRTALITDALVELRAKAAGYGFRLSILGEELKHPELPSYALSLYLFRQIKRPLFFILEGFHTLGREVLWEEPGLLFTRRKPGRYIALLWNPCYIDPFQSLENLRQDMYRKTVRLRVYGIEPGRYRLKCFYIDKGHGSIYHSWLKVDPTAQIDEDVIDYLEHSGNPTVTLEERVVERELEMLQPLALNAAALWSIRRIEAL